SMSYVTGSHALKVGVRLLESYWLTASRVRYNVTPYGAVRFDVRGGTNGVRPVPSAIYELLNPQGAIDASSDHNGASYSLTSALYAQDQWSVRRLTLNLGVRYDAVNAQ